MKEHLIKGLKVESEYSCWWQIMSSRRCYGKDFGKVGRGIRVGEE